MSAFDNYGEDIGGQSYSSYSDTPGDSGGGSDGPRTLTDPTKGFDIAPPPSERLSLLDRIKDFGGNVLGGITSLALGLTPQSLMASQFLPNVFGSIKNRFFPTYETGINTIELDDRFTMPMNKPRNIPFLTEGGITNIDIPNFDPDMNLYAKVVGPALTQMRTLEKAKEMERFGGKPLTETEQKTLDKLKEMDADPNRIYSLPVVV